MGKMRHVEVRQLWMQEQVQEGKIQVFKIYCRQADILTKHVTGQGPRHHFTGMQHSIGNDRHLVMPGIAQLSRHQSHHSVILGLRGICLFICAWPSPTSHQLESPRDPYGHHWVALRAQGVGRSRDPCITC